MADEAKFQAKVVKWLKSKGCIVIKQNAGMYSAKGVPDLFFYLQGFWGALEVKASKSAKKQPGQQQWIDKLAEWSYARFVYPENWEKIKKELEDML